MKSSIYIISNSLKEFLVLLDKDAELTNITLGDTWHPSSGFVDEKILKGKHKVGEILNFDYDFKGLIEFSATIGTARIEMTQISNNKEEYVIKGNAKEIERIRNKVIEVNAYDMDKYPFECHIEYEDKK